MAYRKKNLNSNEKRAIEGMEIQKSINYPDNCFKITATEGTDILAQQELFPFLMHVRKTKAQKSR